MADWAGGYGAGGAAQGLQQLLENRILLAKQAEVERSQRAQEAQQQAELAQRSEQFRQAQGVRFAELAAGQDENFQNRTQHVSDRNRLMQRQTVEDQIRAKELADKSVDETTRTTADQKWHTDESAKNRAFQLYLAGQRGGVSEKDQMETERARLQLEAEKQRQAGAGQERDRQATQSKESTQAAFDSVSRLLDPNGAGAGLDSSYGAYEMRGRLQPAQDFKAERDRLVAMLALPNLGALKGPMSDKDILFIKQISSTLANENISEEQARAELGRAKQFLMERGAVDGSKQQPQTRTLRNRQTGETRTETSTDGGRTWK